MLLNKQCIFNIYGCQNETNGVLGHQAELDQEDLLHGIPGELLSFCDDRIYLLVLVHVYADDVTRYTYTLIDPSRANIVYTITVFKLFNCFSNKKK